MTIAHVRRDEHHMATMFEFVISCDDKLARLADRTLDEAHRLMTTLERELSEFIPESSVAQLNAAEPMRPVKVSMATIELLERSERLRRQTESAFNCAAKSGWDGREPGSARVAFGREARCAWRLDADTRISFGAIGKGYAIDRARELIERAGFTNYLLNAGGSSLAIAGYSGPGRPWSWGWSWERDATGANLGVSFTHPTGTPIAVGVSGTHEQGNHLIDPRQGGTKPTLAASALVAHPSATDADALSTALYVAGWEKGLPLLQSMTASPAAAEIGADRVPRWNGIFQKFWGAPALMALALFAGVPAQAEEPAVLETAPAIEPAQPADTAAPTETAPAPEDKTATDSATASAPETDPPASEEVDLSAMGADTFTPYITERNPAWVALPLFAIAVVLIHLRKNRINTPRKDRA